ncbi:MAG UNVERIFIED_CONTAM: hypothetical protein LVT10_01930 [Anaerolineae bacterium]
MADALHNGNTSPIWHALTRPADLEAEAVGRAIALAHHVHCPIHIFHVGCDASVRRIVAARAQGVAVTGGDLPTVSLLG